jgi:D-serine dehydratase
LLQWLIIKEGAQALSLVIKTMDKRQIPVFNSKAEAFDYMFSELVLNGEELMAAAEKAEAFAAVIAKNRSLPDKPKGVVEQCVSVMQQVTVIKKEYPEMWGIVTGAIGGVIGAVVGTKATAEEEPPAEPLDFDNME